MPRSLTCLASLLLLLTAACSRPEPPAPDPLAITPHSAAIDLGAIRARLSAHRERQLERLDAYAHAGQFPHDYTTEPSLHMFRDDAGRLCAVANLVHRDGRDDLVDTTARSHNDLAIADVSDGPMLDWILASGLTQEELARIQAPAPLVQRAPAVVRPPRPAPRPVEIARNTPPNAMTEAQMTAALRAHIANVEAELRAHADHSLDLAIDRYVAHRESTAGAS
jgi:hypothetical protein